MTDERERRRKDVAGGADDKENGCRPDEPEPWHVADVDARPHRYKFELQFLLRRTDPVLGGAGDF